MLDCALIWTFTPQLPAGAGATLVTAEDAVTEILKDIREHGLKVNDWIDGAYTIFKDYQLVVKTLQRWQFDHMPEFSGYYHIGNFE